MNVLRAKAGGKLYRFIKSISSLPVINAVTILCYHQISYPRLSSHIRFLARYFSFISLEEYVSNINNYPYKNSIRPSIVLTLDDVTEADLLAWKSALKPYNIPSSIFIPTWYCLNNKSLWSHRIIKLFDHLELELIRLDRSRIRFKSLGSKMLYRDNLLRSFQNSTIQTSSLEIITDRLCSLNSFSMPIEHCVPSPRRIQDITLSWDELSIHSHTHLHSKLSLLSSTQLDLDLSESMHVISTLQRKRPKSKIICYPYGSRALIGDWPDSLGDKFDAGVLLGSDNSYANRHMALPRLGIYENDSIPRLFLKILLSALRLK